MGLIIMENGRMGYLMEEELLSMMMDRSIKAVLNRDMLNAAKLYSLKKMEYTLKDK